MAKQTLWGLLVTMGIASATPAWAADDKTFTVKAKLVEIPTEFPPDDLYDYAFVMRYEVIGGELDKKSIFVAHFNPRVARNKVKGPAKKHVSGKLRRFRQDDVHVMTLAKNMDEIWQDAVIDEFFATDRKSPRYWCLKVDPAK